MSEIMESEERKGTAAFDSFYSGQNARQKSSIKESNSQMRQTSNLKYMKLSKNLHLCTSSTISNGFANEEPTVTAIYPKGLNTKR